MESCDVLIVGGGPAGSTCAWELRRHGLDVLVLDSMLFPRDKVCAGWITPAVLDTLQIDSADYASGRVLQPITGFRTGVIDRSEVETAYSRVVSYGIRRCEFDHYLLQRSGARLRLGEPLRSIERSNGGWNANGTIQAKMLVGAGGHSCPVARLLGAQLGAQQSLVVAQEAEFPLDAAQARACRVQPQTPELFFCRDLKGYGWCFRKGDHLNIGLGRNDSRHLSEHLAAFCDFLKRRGKFTADIPNEFHGHAYLLHGHGTRKLLDDGALLIGDAAGLACPQSGEGIRTAVESALLAAQSIIEADRDYRKERLVSYPQRLQARFGPAKSADASILPQRLQRFIGGKLLANAWFTRHIVLDRWFLHAQRHALRTS
ncbi:MAG TPA: NAD(P)/FAD-dependent oxidoreductase [Sulfuricella sp.]|nr:NAD(P)/FAD-dependent oxidoreductase [Sulfuricella sp.]